MEITAVKHSHLWILSCLIGIVVFATTNVSTAECIATLPNGTKVELIGLRN